ncbi:MAG: OmpA family protein [Gemmatimonadaceae bacterium]
MSMLTLRRAMSAPSALSAPSVRHTLASLGLAASIAACAHAPAGGARVPSAAPLTPVADRISDEAIARDLATITAHERQVLTLVSPSTPARFRLARRALQYLALARAAYERNDRSSFPDDALAWARADIEALSRDVGAAEPSSAVPLPTAVVASHAFLGGSACRVEAVSPYTQALDRLEKAPIVPERPAPVPVEDRPLPPRPAARCEGPERLTGVPGIVHFALDRSILSPATREALDRAVAALAPYPGVRVRLSGHTDVRASEAYNQALSERRVNAVREYLASRGVAVERLEASARGEAQPLVNGSGARDHARNRRVEIRYVLCDGSEVPLDEELSDLQLEARRKPPAYREK